ncbi:hypothetical protein ATCC90586_006684 [Pythium insidiosum]|nr:hypothetical protein ATCC90586_006684 [Pythium insidiosum]
MPLLDDAKDALRLDARRQREQERLKKLGPGRLRSIGADIVGVANQLEEKQREQQLQEAAQQRADEEDAAIRRYLLQVESEDATARRQELLTLRNDWQLQALERERREQQAAAARAAPIVVDACAPGAAQSFAGEDPLRLERVRLQAQQLKQWTQQQMEEQRQRDAQDAAAEAQYAATQRELLATLDALHEADERERTRLAVELERVNAQLLETQRRRAQAQAAAEQLANAAEIEATLRSNLVSENPQQAQRADAPMHQRVRVDHWKGLSAEQRRQVVKHNDELQRERQQQREQQRDQERADAAEHRALLRQQTMDEHATQLARAQQQRELRQTLERQAQEARDRERRLAEQSKGAIDGAFFQAFGRSYR